MRRHVAISHVRLVAEEEEFYMRFVQMHVVVYQELSL